MPDADDELLLRITHVAGKADGIAYAVAVATLGNGRRFEMARIAEAALTDPEVTRLWLECCHAAAIQLVKYANGLTDEQLTFRTFKPT